jgi:hypothetical protein
MIKYTITVLLLLSRFFCSGQDGSDMYYIKTDRLDSSFTGKFAHLDFYKRSFRGRSIDTVVIDIDNKPVKFAEHREDNGYDNWFARQYLESVSITGDVKIRMTKWLITAVTEDSIGVTGFFEYYNSQNKPVPGRSFKKDLWFKKEQIIEVLIHAG